jgi:hypothetical protein
MFVPYAYKSKTGKDHQSKNILYQGVLSAAPWRIRSPVWYVFVPLTTFERIDWHSRHLLNVSTTPYFLYLTKAHNRSHAKFGGGHEPSGLHESVGSFKYNKIFRDISCIFMSHACS